MTNLKASCLNWKWFLSIWKHGLFTQIKKKTDINTPNQTQLLHQHRYCSAHSSFSAAFRTGQIQTVSLSFDWKPQFSDVVLCVNPALRRLGQKTEVINQIFSFYCTTRSPVAHPLTKQPKLTMKVHLCLHFMVPFRRVVRLHGFQQDSHVDLNPAWQRWRRAGDGASCICSVKILLPSHCFHAEFLR